MLNASGVKDDKKYTYLRYSGVCDGKNRFTNIFYCRADFQAERTILLRKAEKMGFEINQFLVIIFTISLMLSHMWALIYMK